MASDIQVHHIIPQKYEDHEVIKLLDGLFDINGNLNLLELPSDHDLADCAEMSPHTGGHLGSYMNGMKAFLDNLEKSPDFELAKKGDVKALQRILANVEEMVATARVAMQRRRLFPNTPRGWTAEAAHEVNKKFFEGWRTFDKDRDNRRLISRVRHNLSSLDKTPDRDQSRAVRKLKECLGDLAAVKSAQKGVSPAKSTKLGRVVRPHDYLAGGLPDPDAALTAGVVLGAGAVVAASPFLLSVEAPAVLTGIVSATRAFLAARGAISAAANVQKAGQSILRTIPSRSSGHAASSSITPFGAGAGVSPATPLQAAWAFAGPSALPFRHVPVPSGAAPSAALSAPPSAAAVLFPMQSTGPSSASPAPAAPAAALSRPGPGSETASSAAALTPTAGVLGGPPLSAAANDLQNFAQTSPFKAAQTASARTGSIPFSVPSPSASDSPSAEELPPDQIRRLSRVNPSSPTSVLWAGQAPILYPMPPMVDDGSLIQAPPPPPEDDKPPAKVRKPVSRLRVIPLPDGSPLFY